MLPKTIGSVYALRPAEVIWCLDRCTDESEAIIRSHGEKHIHHTNTHIRHYTEFDGAVYLFRPAYLRRDAYRHAHNDTILNTSADIRLDQSIRKHLEKMGAFKLLSFGYLDYPYNAQSWIKTVVSAATPAHGYAGLLAFSKRAWLETEDMIELFNLPRGEDTHLHLAIAEKYPTRHINTRSLHLRPNESPEDHYNRGEAMYTQLHASPLRAFLTSAVMLRPRQFAGYVKTAAKCAALVPLIPAIAAACYDDSTEEIP